MLCVLSSPRQAIVLISMQQQQQYLRCGQALHCKRVYVVHVLLAYPAAHVVRYLSSVQAFQSKHIRHLQIQDRLLLGAQQSIWNQHQAQSHLASLSHQPGLPPRLPAMHTVLLQHSLTDACGLKHSPKKLHLMPPSSQLTLSSLLTCLPQTSAGQQQVRPAHHHHRVTPRYPQATQQLPQAMLHNLRTAVRMLQTMQKGVKLMQAPHKRMRARQHPTGLQAGHRQDVLGPLCGARGQMEAMGYSLTTTALLCLTRTPLRMSSRSSLVPCLEASMPSRFSQVSHACPDF